MQQLSRGNGDYSDLRLVDSQTLQGLGEMSPTVTSIWTLLSIASTAASAYHGYKRNNSIGWAVGWGLLGGFFPVIVPAVAFAQGFAKPKR